MRLRSKILLTVGLSCLSSAVLAGGAMADGGHKNKPGLEVEVRGLVTGLTAATPTTPGSITVSPGGTLAPWTCALKPGADTTGITLVPASNVKVKCRTKNGVLTAKRVRTTTNMTGKVKLEATGLVTAFTAFTPAVAPAVGTNGSITIDAGITGLPLPVTCAITNRTRIRSIPVLNVDTAKIECKSKDDALVAKKIKVKHPKVPAMYGSGHKKGHH